MATDCKLLLLDLRYDEKRNIVNGKYHLMNRILVTGAGGTAGVNFTRAVKLDKGLQIFGTELNEYHTIFADEINVSRVPSPKNPEYINSLNRVIDNYKISFVHPQPTPELHAIVRHRDDLSAKTFLPETEVVLKDKFAQQRLLEDKKIPVAKTHVLSDLKELDTINEQLSYPVWVRARRGVGGLLGNKCRSLEEITLWIKLCTIQGRAKIDDFLLQEYFGGRDIAWDSLWYEGKMVVSYCRERLEYPFSKLTMSGITGTPTVSRIIHSDQVNQTAINAVKAISKKPHGCFSIDIKENDDGVSHITEVDSGKFHTTIGLWGFLAEKNLALPWFYNLPRLYVHLGNDGRLPTENEVNIYPENLYLIRNLDCGAWIRRDNRKERVI